MSDPMVAATHDFSRTMGSECCIREVVDAGRLLKLYGWTYESLAVGDYLILSHKADRSQTTRYRLTKFDRPGDPRDQWFGEATFAPRTVEAT